MSENKEIILGLKEYSIGNYDRAKLHFTTAHNNGYLDATYNLALLYVMIYKNVDYCIELIQYGANNKHEKCIEYLVLYYIFLKKDVSKGLYWITQLGDPSIYLKIAEIYKQNGNYEESLVWYLLSYDNGCVEVAANIAQYYLQKGDKIRSLYYLNKHNENESEISLLNLAIYYRFYNKNYALMKQFAIRAITMCNSGICCDFLANYYYHNEKNEIEQVKFLILGSKLNNINCLETLKQIYYNNGNIDFSSKCSRCIDLLKN